MKSSLYIHIPYCISKCLYCDFYSIPHTKVPDEYVNALCNEIIYRCKNKPDIKTVYIGGGTPSLLEVNQLIKILDSINSVCKLQKDAEITIEVNPDDVSEAFISEISKTCINRISCGIQSMNNDSLAYVHRRGNRDDNIQALSLLAKLWKKNFSVDLICGLPEETDKSFISSLKEVISYNPDHISMYSLTIEDNTPLEKLLNDGKLNYDFEYADSLWIKSRKYLEDKGYLQYEVSNFAKTGKESKHNLTYWNHDNYIGCGSAGTGTVYSEDGTGFRWTNTDDLKEYIEFWNKSLIYEENIPCEKEIINLEISKFEFFMMGLRKLSGISQNQYKSIFAEKIPDKICELFRKWNKKKLCNIEEKDQDTIYSLNNEGILFLNIFLEELMEISL